jgi:hypothetical protein
LPPCERAWIAGRYDANRVIVYLDSTEFRDTVLASARNIVVSQHGGSEGEWILHAECDV